MRFFFLFQSTFATVTILSLWPVVMVTAFTVPRTGGFRPFPPVTTSTTTTTTTTSSGGGRLREGRVRASIRQEFSTDSTAQQEEEDEDNDMLDTAIGLDYNDSDYKPAEDYTLLRPAKDKVLYEEDLMMDLLETEADRLEHDIDSLLLVEPPDGDTNFGKEPPNDNHDIYSNVPATSRVSQQPVTTMICDFDGRPLSKDYFCRAMDLDPSLVESYECPEADAFRGFMSNACRIRFHPGGVTAFYKHVIFQDLPHAREKLRKAPHKLRRDIRSYEVVAQFLRSHACDLVREATGIRIPQCYDAQLQPSHDHPMESKFSFLLEDLSPADGWYQKWLLDDDVSVQAAVHRLAQLHAYFWSGSDFGRNHPEAAEELEAAIWKSGSYVQPQAQGWEQCQKVAQEWKIKRMRFAKELSSYDYWETLGTRLESVAEEVGRVAHPFADDVSDTGLPEAYAQYRTFTHGDPKQANILFRKSDNDDDNNALELGLIDFQWSGFGLAATDFAHFMTSAVHADQLVDGGEERLMRYYYDELQTNLVKFGAYTTTEEARLKYSYETFEEQYKTGVLDICRIMIAYTWDRFEEPVTKDDQAACARTMNKTSYNKSVPNIVWLLSRCDEILKSRGV